MILKVNQNLKMDDIFAVFLYSNVNFKVYKYIKILEMF